MSNFIEERAKKFCAYVKGSFESFINKEGSGSKDSEPDPEFASIEEYTAVTGKRFRRTREEIDLGLSPEESFRKRF